MIMFQYLSLYIFISLMAVTVLSDPSDLAVTASCSPDSQPCGFRSTCCPSGFKCNFLRGIPICSNPNKTSLSGFDYIPCPDPYSYECDAILGIRTGLCCPIGSVCRVQDTSDVVKCINEYGETQSAIPSSTTGFLPSVTPVTKDAVFSPTHAWNTLPNNHSCSTSKTFYTTSTINATVTINYSGPSIMINTITSPNGGVLTVNVDGFRTGSEIDTYVAPTNSFPICFPVQFPPFLSVPPGFESRDSHTMILTFVGASKDAPRDSESSIQLLSFALPDHDNASRLRNDGSCKVIVGLTGRLGYILTMFVIFFLLV